MYKVAGAAAEEGQSLKAIVAVAERMSQNMRVLSVAARTATHPSTGMELSPLGDDEMEIGAGQHGETWLRAHEAVKRGWNRRDHAAASPG